MAPQIFSTVLKNIYTDDGHYDDESKKSKANENKILSFEVKKKSLLPLSLIFRKGMVVILSGIKPHKAGY